MGNVAFVRIMMLGCYTDGGRGVLTIIVFVQYDLKIENAVCRVLITCALQITLNANN